MSIGSILKNELFFIRGFKKVALNDSKGVLSSKNNFKWVKSSKKLINRNVYGTEITYLPSGTKIKKVLEYDAYGNNPQLHEKIITKKDGLVTKRGVAGTIYKFFKGQSLGEFNIKTRKWNK